MENNVLNIEHLSKIYHTKKEEIKAVEDITFSLKEGEFVSIVGPSGCGKSTILSMLCHLINPSGGNIELLNHSSIGYMLQEDNLLDFRSILNNCLLGLEIQNKKTKENVDYVKHLLSTYGLKEFINSYPSSLSGGMRQRVLRMLYTHGKLKISYKLYK